MVMETGPAGKPPDVSQPALATKCPMTAALNAIGGKWSLICLYWLDSGTRRFNELRRLMPDISHKVLTATLRSLENEGLICRRVYAEVPASSRISDFRSRRISAPDYAGGSSLGP